MGDGSETVSKAPSVLIRELPNVSAPCGCLLDRHGFMHSQKRCPARPVLRLDDGFDVLSSHIFRMLLSDFFE
jgi:hypothetical protein